jgi:hypothetical protein
VTCWSGRSVMLLVAQSPEWREMVRVGNLGDLGNLESFWKFWRCLRRLSGCSSRLLGCRFKETSELSACWADMPNDLRALTIFVLALTIFVLPQGRDYVFFVFFVFFVVFARLFLRCRVCATWRCSPRSVGLLRRWVVSRSANKLFNL